MTKSARIKDVKAFASSFPLAPDAAVTLGIGRNVKRDAVIVKVLTEDGLIGFGESHHGRCPGAVAHLVNTTLRQLVVGMDAFDVVGVWNRIYRMQLSSHGMGTAAVIAMSGIDMALWDIRAKAVVIDDPKLSVFGIGVGLHEGLNDARRFMALFQKPHGHLSQAWIGNGHDGSCTQTWGDMWHPCADRQRACRRADSQHDPVGLDVWNVVEHEPANGHRSQIHQAGGFFDM